MEHFCRGFFIALFAAGYAFSASAEDRPRAPDHAARGAPSPGPVLTGKERLGRKWMDEQRINNCKVPPDKRGTKPRPDTCAPTS
jgi:hypothetical protein